MNQTLKNIKEGKLAIFHNAKGISGKLSKILKEVFPDDNRVVSGSWTYYYKDIHYPKTWSYSDYKPSYMNSMTTDEVYQQLFPEKKLKGYKLNGKVSKEKIANLLTCTTATKDGLFFWEGNLDGNYPPFDKAKELGILDLWFEPVYEDMESTLTLESGKIIKIDKYNGFSFEGSVLSKEKLDYMLLPIERVNGYDIHAQSWTVGCVKFTREDALKALKLFNQL